MKKKRVREETNPRCSYYIRNYWRSISCNFFFLFQTHRTNRFNKQVFIGYNGRTSEKNFFSSSSSHFFSFFFFAINIHLFQSREFLINLHLTRQIFSSRINQLHSWTSMRRFNLDKLLSRNEIRDFTRNLNFVYVMKRILWRKKKINKIEKS